MALFLPQQRLLILHIPHTGGTWIKAALSSWGVGFEQADGLGDHNLPEAYDHPGVARAVFIRHPVTWLESMWRGHHGGWPVDRPGTAMVRERYWSPNRLLGRLFGERDFEAFIRRYLEEQPGFVGRMVEWFVGPPGWPKVDFVGRQERLRDHLVELLRKSGWQGEAPPVLPENVSTHPLPEWPAGLQERVIAAEQPLLKRFYTYSADPSWVGEVW